MMGFYGDKSVCMWKDAVFRFKDINLIISDPFQNFLSSDLTDKTFYVL